MPIVPQLFVAVKAHHVRVNLRKVVLVTLDTFLPESVQHSIYMTDLSSTQS